jgi:AbiV
MKAFIIVNTTIYPHLKETSFKKAFEDHKSKLRAIRSIAGFTAMLNAYMTLWIEPMIEIMDEPENDRTNKRKVFFENLLSWFKNEAKSSETALAKELKWWENAKTIKEDGFYVRVNKDKWYTPASISKAKFLISIKINYHSVCQQAQKLEYSSVLYFY